MAPGRSVSPHVLAPGLDTSDEEIASRKGMRSRRCREEGVRSWQSCVAAARIALKRARARPADADVIIVAAFTPGQPLASTVLTMEEQLGAGRDRPLDSHQAARAGGACGPLPASRPLRTDGLEAILVIGAETLPRITDPEDRCTSVSFEDAARATAVQRTPPGTGPLSWDSKPSCGMPIPPGGSGRDATATTVCATSPLAFSTASCASWPRSEAPCPGDSAAPSPSAITSRWRSVQQGPQKRSTRAQPRPRGGRRHPESRGRAARRPCRVTPDRHMIAPGGLRCPGALAPEDLRRDRGAPGIRTRASGPRSPCGCDGACTPSPPPSRHSPKPPPR
ncbi:hypothetical protein AB0H77_38330 [Streptomyces sp. NPDC050844]|uniref:hypothetical protein n=1 Tax=Streptomyces sp. NPDC050844 TaxID=3155790 RepID=UPI0033C25912